MAISTAQYTLTTTATSILSDTVAAEEVHLHVNGGTVYVGARRLNKADLCGPEGKLWKVRLEAKPMPKNAEIDFDGNLLHDLLYSTALPPMRTVFKNGTATPKTTPQLPPKPKRPNPILLFLKDIFTVKKEP